MGAWRRCIRFCYAPMRFSNAPILAVVGAFFEAWVQIGANGCIISFRDAPMQYDYAPMNKNRCIKEKESPAANLLAVSKKAAGLL